MRRLLPLLCFLAAAGCGGSDDPKPAAKPAAKQSSPATGTEPRATRRERPARAADEKVISAWARTLRRGDTDGAADFFALPAIVQNSTPPLRITTHRQAVAFQDTLPCGARFLRAFRAGRYTVATFRLTERRGSGQACNGTGSEASTAFLIERGKIREWRRVVPGQDDESPPTTES